MAGLHALVLAGGSGTRFWPWSRESRPKQCLALDGERSLIERTLERLDGLVHPERRWVLTRADLADSVRALVPGLPAERLLAEPEGRDTAPALALAALRIRAEDPGAILLALPSDHHIADAGAFRRTVERAVAALERDDALYTFGVQPREPATGFGYIELGEPTGSPGVRHVRAFREKPDLATAERYVAGGEHRWNAGIFLWRADTFLDELERVSPDFRPGLSALEAALGAPSPCAGSVPADAAGAIAAAFARLPRISIDYALLERSGRVRVVDADFPWDDVGSWEAIARLRRGESDAAGNVVGEDGLAIGSRDSLALAPRGKAIVLLGVEELLVIDSPDALLVCPRHRAQEVKGVVEELRRRGRRELL